MIKISIIVPTYNAEPYLKKCLDSLINQTLKDIEIIIINDGSTDHSQDIVDEYCKKYANIKAITKENGGQACARNKGIELARGKYLSFVDSDDWLDVTFCEKLYNEAISNKADIVTCDAYKVINDQLEYFNLNVNYSNDIFKNYVINQTGPWGKIIKRDLIVNHNLFFLEKHIYEDLAVVPSYILFTNNIVHLNECLYYYLIRIGSTMKQTKYNPKMEHIFSSIDKLYQIFHKYHQDNKYHDELCYLYIEHLIHGATLTFLPFKEGHSNILKSVDIINNKYPKWYQNIYFKNKNWKYKLICYLIMHKQIKIVKLLLRR